MQKWFALWLLSTKQFYKFNGKCIFEARKLFYSNSFREETNNLLCTEKPYSILTTSAINCYGKGKLILKAEDLIG